MILVSLNSFFVRGILEIQPAIVGQIMGGKSYDLAIVTAAAGLGSLLASGWIGLGKLEQSHIQKHLGLCSSPELWQALFCISL